MTLAELEPYRNKLEGLTQKTGKCWFYTGRLGKGNRGHMRIGSKTIDVRKMAYELSFKEEVPEGFIIKMWCETSNCINPDHMELGRKTFGWLQ